MTLLLACVAALLNAIAPVLAYAAGQPLHELASGRPGGGARAVLAHAHAHEHAPADEHAAHHAAKHEKPEAPHCPYCLDFAAGAALAPTLLTVGGVLPHAAPHLARAPEPIATRSSLRLASPRAPPFAG